MFSRRIRWSLEQNEYSKLLHAKRAGGAALLDLTESNPTQAGIAYPAAILSALGDVRGLIYEPNPWGLPHAREAVAAVEKAPAERVMLTASTSESYGYLFKLLCNPGDRVLIPRPSYPLFEFLARLENVEVVHYSLRYHRQWEIDFDSLRERVTPRTRAILLVNPNNPTGSYIRPAEVAQLGRLCAQHSLAVVSDEVFHEYPLDSPVHTDWGPAAEGTLVVRLNGLSKMAGLPQMKAGWMILDGPPKICREAGERLELIADTYLSVSTPVQHALPELLRLGDGVRRQILERLRGNLHWLRSMCGPLPVEGGWYAILQLPEGFDEHAFVLDLLDQDEVLVQPGYFYDFEVEGFLVLSLLAKPEEFREGVERLLRRISRMRPA
ncbi:MAG: pyridoxal phosphate-dependent aminotransferase [Bryobacterales bacterium]|nr:pyridoxal phosphate-dependent aminotransferase [Bryobacterales bacterium]